VTYESLVGGGVSANIVAVGVIDWGRTYATVNFPIHGNRSVLVGWTYVRPDMTHFFRYLRSLLFNLCAFLGRR
jgi:hypothetical protein